MATKIRLARHGKKAYAFYHIVVADGRAPRDGRFIEKIGTYNPNTNPATIEVDFDRAVYWVGVGAQPTDTTRAILSYKGVMMMHHLNGGVRKGALTEEQAKAKFDLWLSSKEAQVESKKLALASASTKSKADRMAAETKAKDAKASAVAAKLAASAKAAEADSAEETAETAPEVAAEEVATEAAAE